MFFAAPAGATAAHLTAEAPPGFDELSSSHVILVDVYFGGIKIAESLALHRPGTLKFRNPHEILGKISEAIVTPVLESAIAQDLPANSEHACVMSNAAECGLIKPDVLGIIYDEDRFRVDLFVNPKFLHPSTVIPSGYLSPPDADLSLTDTAGLNASGTIGGKSAYDIQNRTIIALRNGRVRADTAISSGLGLLVDDLVGEIDSKTLRYSAGLFWAGSNDFIGRRRILGGGIATQFDTCSDREALRSTPLIVFLADPSRVDILVDGRLVTSRSYSAGNVEIDTSGLAEGSYPVVLQIHHGNGSVEDERRFFVKNSQIPAAGHPFFYAYGGVLAKTRANNPISPSRTVFYELGAARRLSNALAVDVEAFGTQHKTLLEGGGWLVSGRARMRAAALISTSGDWGALLQVGLTGAGPFTMNLDVRRVWSRDQKPLIPLAASIGTFDIAPPDGVQLAVGSYTQATASFGLRVLDGFLSIVGAYRKDHNAIADYTIGPSLSLPVITRNSFQLVFDVSAQRSRTSAGAFAGLRVLLSSKHLSVGGEIGEAAQSDRGAEHRSFTRTVANLSAQWSQSGPAGSEITVEGDAARNINSSTVHAQALASGRFGDLRADVLKNLEDGHAPQYNLAFQSGLALGLHGSAWGSRELEQSALILAVSGDARDATFRVLVDNVSRGEIKVGHRLAVFVPGYRTYAVRLVPTSSQSVSYDTAERTVTLYPGNVRTLKWTADAYFTMFGQAMGRDGAPIANALMQTAKGVAETDEHGYFQIDTRREEAVLVSPARGASCKLKLGDVIVKNDFASVGKVICE